MKMELITDRIIPPAPWSEGDNIPWNDPDFSRRMLAEHLNQEHDMASRRLQKIKAQADWINRQLLNSKPSRILDLGCGPGLYTNHLAGLGHDCRGIDFSPASIEYAREQASIDNLNCKFEHQDIRTAEYGSGYDLVMLIYGEFNVFRPVDIDIILNKIKSALKPGGYLLLEPHKHEAIRRLSDTPSAWHTAKSGLFADNPHIWMSESFWDENSQAGTIRYFVIESGQENITTFSVSYQAYTDDQYRNILSKHGFSNHKFYPALPDFKDDAPSDLSAITSQK